MASVKKAAGPELTVIVPCYNEEGAVAEGLAAIRAALDGGGIRYEILAVDDGSSDRTPEILAGEDAPVRWTRNPTNMGYGAAIKRGLRSSSAPLVAIIDADGTYPAEELPSLYEKVASGACDMAVGSRTGEQVEIPLLRRPPKWFLRKLAHYVAGFPIPDVNSGLRVFSRETALKLMPVLPDGFSLTTTITLAMITNGYRVEYQPINYFRRTGFSKIRPIRDTLNFLMLTLKMALYFAPLKIFIPVSLLMMALAVVWASLSLLLLGSVADVSTLTLVIAAIQMGAIGMVAELVRWNAAERFRNDD